jgi:hypothetical protein
MFSSPFALGLLAFIESTSLGASPFPSVTALLEIAKKQTGLGPDRVVGVRALNQSRLLCALIARLDNDSPAVVLVPDVAFFGLRLTRSGDAPRALARAEQI